MSYTLWLIEDSTNVVPCFSVQNYFNIKMVVKISAHE